MLWKTPHRILIRRCVDPKFNQVAKDGENTWKKWAHIIPIVNVALGRQPLQPFSSLAQNHDGKICSFITLLAAVNPSDILLFASLPYKCSRFGVFVKIVQHGGRIWASVSQIFAQYKMQGEKQPQLCWWRLVVSTEGGSKSCWSKHTMVLWLPPQVCFYELLARSHG